MDKTDEVDELLAMVFARLGAIESALCVMWNEHPNRELVRRLAETVHEARQAASLASAAPELRTRIEMDARQSSFDAIFHELLPTKDRDALRSARPD